MKQHSSSSLLLYFLYYLPFVYFVTSFSLSYAVVLSILIIRVIRMIHKTIIFMNLSQRKYVTIVRHRHFLYIIKSKVIN